MKKLLSLALEMCIRDRRKPHQKLVSASECLHLNYIPVSYTHLDVYKRQSLRRRPPGCRRPPGPSSAPWTAGALPG